MTIRAWVPVETRSEANVREHWARKSRRARMQRTATTIALQAERMPPPTPRDIVVVLTRVAPRTLDDDNLARSLKAVRDAVASYLAIDDRSPDVSWLVRQERSKGHGVRVTIYESNEAEAIAIRTMQRDANAVLEAS